MPTHLLPYMLIAGAKKQGLSPMNNMYNAFDTLIIDPSVLYVAATSGIAERTVVDDMGARKLQKDITATTINFLFSEKR